MSSSCPTDTTKEQLANSSRSPKSTMQSQTAKGSEISIKSTAETDSRDDPSNGCIQEDPSSSRDLITLSATHKDILCGRGLHVMNRHGNLNLHLLVNKYRPSYGNSTRQGKAAITRQIVQEIKSTGARFIRRANNDIIRGGRWVEVDDKTAYNKVSHALRLRKKDHGQQFATFVEAQEDDENRAMTAESGPGLASSSTLDPSRQLQRRELERRLLDQQHVKLM